MLLYYNKIYSKIYLSIREFYQIYLKVYIYRARTLINVS